MSVIDRIEMITLACPDPAAAEAAYCRHLRYRRHGAGRISAQLAALWGLEAVADAEYVLLTPENDNRHFIRLIRVDAGAEYRPFSAAGWNAAEILVNDVDALAERLADSPFTIVGPPADLSFTDKIRACQVLGPAAEALYLTQIKGPIPGFSLPMTEAAVAHCFVVILAAASLSAARDFYRTRFAIAGAPVINARVSMLSAAFGLPRERLHKISALALGNPAYLIEVDELPSDDVVRQPRQDSLPPGIAMVSVACNAPPHRGGSCVLADPPYHGRQVGFCTGAAGEMLELIYT